MGGEGRRGGRGRKGRGRLRHGFWGDGRPCYHFYHHRSHHQSVPNSTTRTCCQHVGLATCWQHHQRTRRQQTVDVVQRHSFRSNVKRVHFLKFVFPTIDCWCLSDRSILADYWTVFGCLWWSVFLLNPFVSFLFDFLRQTKLRFDYETTIPRCIRLRRK